MSTDMYQGQEFSTAHRFVIFYFPSISSVQKAPLSCRLLGLQQKNATVGYLPEKSRARSLNTCELSQWSIIIKKAILKTAEVQGKGVPS